MKHNIFFKSLAILLCALSLFGAVASVAGMVAMAEGDLYNKSVDQMLSTRLRDDGYAYADYLARRYASMHIGGVPEAMAEVQLSQGDWFFRNYDQEHYGYVILDAEGNELAGYNVDLKNSPDHKFIESFPAEGRYMHLISLESQEDAQQALRQEREAIYDAEPIVDFYDNLIPAQGVVVDYVSFVSKTGELLLDAYHDGYSVQVAAYDQNGVNHETHNNAQVGILMFDQTRHLVFHSFFQIRSDFLDQAVAEVCFRGPNGLNLRIRSEDHVGTLYYKDDGFVGFVSAAAALPAEAAVEETVPPTVPETIPPTVPETVPPMIAETAAPETVPPETWVEGEPSAASAVPEEGAWIEETQAPAQLPEEIPQTVPPTEPVVTTPPETTAPPTEATVPQETEPALINGKPLTEYQINSTTYFDRSAGEVMEAEFVYLAMPELTVELFLEDDALRYAPVYDILRLIQPYRNYLLPAAAAFALLFALFGVYLITAAGCSSKQEEIRADGLNRLPLDLYAAAAGTLIFLLILVPMEMANVLLQTDFLLCGGIVAGAVFLICLIFVGFCFAVAAQYKTGGGFWYKNSLFVRLLSWLVAFSVGLERWLAAKLIPFLGKLMKFLWGLVGKLWKWFLGVMKTTARACFRSFQQFLALLPLNWQWFLGGFLLIAVALISGAMGGGGMLFGIALCSVLVFYAAHSYGILADSTRRMSKGDLDTKVDDKNLLGCFKESAADLNALADVAVVAAQKQLKSERMKTELITNVSHDIKTPLTSIINYVDLLQKPHTEQEQAQYLEVLERQSQRLKKLIDDLMDMSKANTGNMTVEITQLDAVESVNQALGEFADKLEKARITPVFRHTSDSVPMMGDGKLVWRVLSNLLGNAVKYAMPGTRLYVDLQSMEGKVVLSLKNISREELNVDAGELMERFVRGDDSRNTEGSGLGLNIAQSLMELQKGQLQLLVDGDLFKVTLTFPGV